MVLCILYLVLGFLFNFVFMGGLSQSMESDTFSLTLLLSEISKKWHSISLVLTRLIGNF